MFDPREFGNRPWMTEFAQAPATLIFDDFVRVYFATRPAPSSDSQYVSYTGFADFDRTDLTKVLSVSKEPILLLGGLGTFDEFGIYPTSLIRDGTDVIAYYGGWTRCESVPYNVAIGMARSTDGGRSFAKAGPGPVLSYGIDEPMTVSGPKIRRFHDTLYMWYVAGLRWTVSDGRPESIFKIRMATSKDGISWVRVGRNLIPDVLEADECQASPDVFELDGSYHMLFSYKFGSGFRNTDRGYRIGYAHSDDLVHWTRNDSMAGIQPSSDGGWDGQSVAYPHVFKLDGRLWLLYLGDEVGRYGFGLAVHSS